jgi:hypothetical protein
MYWEDTKVSTGSHFFPSQQTCRSDVLCDLSIKRINPIVKSGISVGSRAIVRVRMDGLSWTYSFVLVAVSISIPVVTIVYGTGGGGTTWYASHVESRVTVTVTCTVCDCDL